MDSHVKEIGFVQVILKISFKISIDQKYVPSIDCSNKNFAWRNECNRCKNPRSDGGNSSSAPRNMSSQRDRGDGGGNYRGNFNQGPMRGSGPSGGNRQRPY